MIKMINIRKMALIATLSAISFQLMLLAFPLLPVANFLQVDFSVLPILISLVLLDIKSAMLVLLFRSVLKLLLNNQGITTYIGLPMNIIAVGLFVLPFAFVWKRERTAIRFFLASLIGTILLSFSMILLNYFYVIPLYSTFAHFDIEKVFGVSCYLLEIVIPFNLMQGLLFSFTFWTLYFFLKPILRLYEP